MRAGLAERPTQSYCIFLAIWANPLDLRAEDGTDSGVVAVEIVGVGAGPEQDILSWLVTEIHGVGRRNLCALGVVQLVCQVATATRWRQDSGGREPNRIGPMPSLAGSPVELPMV